MRSISIGDQFRWTQRATDAFGADSDLIGNVFTVTKLSLDHSGVEYYEAENGLSDPTVVEWNQNSHRSTGMGLRAYVTELFDWLSDQVEKDYSQGIYDSPDPATEEQRYRERRDKTFSRMFKQPHTTPVPQRWY